MITQTERTYLRYFLESDSADLYEYLSKEDIYEYEPGAPITRIEATRIAQDRANGKNFIAVIDRQTTKLIGHFSFFQSEPEYAKAFELGFIFNPLFQGKGYATEAGKAFIEYCFNVLKAHRITANCNPDNEKSWKLLERLGFVREGLLIKNIYFKKNEGKPIWLNTYIYGLVNDKD